MESSVAALSFEFTPEYSEAALDCIDMLDALGMSEFNYSDGESMKLDTPYWCDKNSIKDRLLSAALHSFGDVYAGKRGTRLSSG